MSAFSAAFVKLVTVLCTFGLKLVAPAAGSLVGMVNVDEFRKAVLKACGYSTVPALAVGVLTWIAANDSAFIKNAALAGAISTAIGIVLNTFGYLKQGQPQPSPKAMAECDAPACPHDEPRLLPFPAAPATATEPTSAA